MRRAVIERCTFVNRTVQSSLPSRIAIAHIGRSADAMGGTIVQGWTERNGAIQSYIPVRIAIVQRGTDRNGAIRNSILFRVASTHIRSSADAMG
jgi:hypothetical protein